MVYIHQEIEIKENPLGIPYFRRDDPSSHSYVNLRAEPDMIALLPELNDCSPLREVRERAQYAFYPFETFGCEKWSSDWSNESFPGFNIRNGSYVDIAPVDPTLCNSPEIYYR